jgi:hypothetical protein
VSVRCIVLCSTRTLTVEQWPVEAVSRVECFSEKPLAELRGTT